MEETMKAPAVASATLHAELLAFARAPGRWPVQAREPALLFASVPAILAIAATAREQDAAVRAAALFFVRVALLYPDADAHAVFGYRPGDDLTDLKDRYRLLARLTHPDRAAAIGLQWPEGTAARINRASEVLGSPALPDAPAAPAAASAAPVALHARRAPRRRARKPAVSRFGARATCGVALAAAVIAGLLLDTPDGDHLVQAPLRTVVAAVAGVPVLSDMAPVRLHLSRELGQTGR
ncbi:J domain-containing protein [Ramlibacter terrae]|uniref:J domain-containing protein n=1 Tax=Ramlibacter terrae TaxID=2732511 RepID=A0ABX6P5D2_9BURK|nr:J domain-containing protein [Ramlibacter terrae]